MFIQYKKWIIRELFTVMKINTNIGDAKVIAFWGRKHSNKSARIIGFQLDETKTEF